MTERAIPETKGRAPCGPHTELAKNDGARITRCACGAVHLHLSRVGVSVQLTGENLHLLAAATAEASRELANYGDRGGAAPDRCVN